LKEHSLIYIALEMEQIGYWINTPQWEGRYEEISGVRASATGGWMLHEPAYTSWRAKRKPVSASRVRL
jgi:hypothetical protein